MAGWPSQAASSVVQHKGLHSCRLRNTYRTLAVHRVKNDGALRSCARGRRPDVVIRTSRAARRTDGSVIAARLGRIEERRQRRVRRVPPPAAHRLLGSQRELGEHQRLELENDLIDARVPRKGATGGVFYVPARDCGFSPDTSSATCTYGWPRSRRARAHFPCEDSAGLVNRVDRRTNRRLLPLAEDDARAGQRLERRDHLTQGFRWSSKP